MKKFLKTIQPIALCLLVVLVVTYLVIKVHYFFGEMRDKAAMIRYEKEKIISDSLDCECEKNKARIDIVKGNLIVYDNGIPFLDDIVFRGIIDKSNAFKSLLFSCGQK